MVYFVNTRDGSIKYKNEIQNDECSVPRSGKWTAEEEALANSLVEQFEEGSLLDCLEGTTLRCYLAKRLNCAPMRISKKFAGKCIGKHIFARKHNFKISIDDNKKIPCVSPSNISFLQSIEDGNTLNSFDFDNKQGLNSISIDSTENLSQIQCPILDSNSSLLSFFNTDTTTATSSTNATYTITLPENINKKRTYNTAFLCTPNNNTTTTTASATKTNTITTAITTDSIDDNDNIGLDLDDFFPEELHSPDRNHSETLKFTFSSLLLPSIHSTTTTCTVPTVPLPVSQPVVVTRPEYQNRSLTPISVLPSGVLSMYTNTTTNTTINTTINSNDDNDEVNRVNKQNLQLNYHQNEILKNKMITEENKEIVGEVDVVDPSYTECKQQQQCKDEVELKYSLENNTIPSYYNNYTTTMSMIQNDEWTEIFTLLA